MTIEDQIKALKGVNFASGGTVKLDQTTAQQYYNAIRYYRGWLNNAKQSVQGNLVAPWGSAGNLASAQKIKQILAADQTEALSNSIDKFLEYLDTLEASLKAAFKSIHAIDLEFDQNQEFKPPPVDRNNPFDVNIMFGLNQYLSYGTDNPIIDPNNPLAAILPIPK
ncbi:hypothetical protein BKG69_23280 [Mycobacteroides chelonae]|uniref:hypothetical protein n=1 Tax=Mycobacteroides chelonae TaxID=1774 RepID=UPI0008A83171|nr:hypothetical protein [Mycobacteroides chelonae]OHT77314.1 hypothetical protein BKG69_23280 [Mycobacteroides chelonae]GLE55290.1 hypothetical protein NJBCHELONAE_06010 [Mycobacteroides chelonae]